MKKTNKILAIVLVLMMVIPMFSIFASAVAGQTWTVAGVKALCGTDWDTANKNNDMTYDAATDSYVKVFTNVKAGNYQFKCARDHKWDVAYPGSNYNLKVEKDGSTVTITLKGTTVTAKVEAPACDHKYEVTAATVTCLTGGSRTWTCSVCGDSYTEEKLDALGHYYDEAGKCIRCDATTEFVRVYVDNAAKWAEVYCYTWDTNPYIAWPGEKITLTTEDGLLYYDIPKNFVHVIFNNGDSTQSLDLKVPTTAATIYNNSTKTWSAPHVCQFSDPTCTEPGKCSCGLTQGVALGHDIVPDQAKAPTCTETGLTAGEHCSRCDAMTVAQEEVPATGHLYVLDVCVLCNDIKPSLVVGENTVVVPPAATEGGTASKFGMIAITEAATYSISGSEGQVLCFFTTPIGSEGSDFSIAADGTLGASWWVFSTTPTELQPGLYYVGIYGEGEHVVTIEKYEAPAECEHVWFYNICTLCYAPNPYFENNFTTVGENKLVCNEYHLVDDTGRHGKPYQFTFTTIPEDGHYVFTSNSNLGIFIYTIPYDAEDEGWVVNGPNWNAVTAGEADLKAGTYYLGFIFYDGVGEYDLTITKADPQPPVDDPVDPQPPVDDPVDPQPPVDDGEGEAPVEMSLIEKIIAFIMELISKILAMLKK